MHPTIIIGTVRSLWTWLWGRYHVPQNVFLVFSMSFISVVWTCWSRSVSLKHLHSIEKNGLTNSQKDVRGQADCLMPPAPMGGQEIITSSNFSLVNSSQACTACMNNAMIGAVALTVVFYSNNSTGLTNR